MKEMHASIQEVKSMVMDWDPRIALNLADVPSVRT